MLTKFRAISRSHNLQRGSMLARSAAVALLVAMGIGGCGGGSEDDASTSPTAIRLAATASNLEMTKVTFTNSDDQTLTGFAFRDTAVPSRDAAVVLMHGCSGVWSNGVVDTSDQPAIKSLSYIHRRWGAALAREGFTVLLVDSFTPRGLINECGNGTAGLDEAVVRPRDAIAGRSWLITQGTPAQRIALLGWSNGGSATLATMDQTNAGPGGARLFAEAFAFYPGCGLLNNFGGGASTLSRTTWLPYAPVSMFLAELDPLAIDGRCANRVAGAIALGASVATGNEVKSTTYAGAHHSFDQIDLSKTLSSPYTADDSAAQTAADAVVLSRLRAIFPIVGAPSQN